MIKVYSRRTPAVNKKLNFRKEMVNHEKIF